MSKGGQVSRSGSGRSGCGFVFVLPRASMERHEIDLVMDRRSRFRASWQNCAEMVGRSVHDVRVACDPHYQHDLVSDLAPTPVKLREFDEISLRVLNLLGEVAGSYAASLRSERDASVSELMTRLDLSANRLGRALPDLEKRGLVLSRRLPTGRFAWRLSREGQALVVGVVQ